MFALFTVYPIRYGIWPKLKSTMLQNTGWGMVLQNYYINAAALCFYQAYYQDCLLFLLLVPSLPLVLDSAFLQICIMWCTCKQTLERRLRELWPPLHLKSPKLESLNFDYNCPRMEEKAFQKFNSLGLWVEVREFPQTSRSFICTWTSPPSRMSICIHLNVPGCTCTLYHNMPHKMPF